jgi:hypothetical protein
VTDFRDITTQRLLVCRFVDPRRDGIQEGNEEHFARFLRNSIVGIDEITRLRHVRFWLRHRQHIHVHECLTQMMVRAKGAESERGHAHDRAGFPAEHAMSARARSDVDRIL